MKDIKTDLIIFGICVFLGIIFGLYYFGFPDFDFYSYHYYNGWAFWNNRLDTDFMPAHIRTYFNPILDGLNFKIIQILNDHPLIFIIISTLKISIMLFLGYKIFNLVLNKNNNKFDNLIRNIFYIVLVLYTPMIVGGSLRLCMVDIIIGILILTSLFIFLKFIFEKYEIKRNLFILVSGLILGIAFGLKYTCISYIITFPLLIIFMNKSIEKSFKTSLILCAGILSGYVMINGYWMIILWNKFHNPMFPYFDNIFHSEYGNHDMILDMDFNHLKPHTFKDFLFYPLKDSFHFKNVGVEHRYIDLKNQIGYFAVILSFILLIKDNIRKSISEVTNLKYYFTLLIFVTFSYISNLLIFGQIRYIMPTYVVIPFIIYVFCHLICNKSSVNYILSLIIICTIGSNFNFKYKKREWIHPQKIVQIKNVKIKDGATVLCGTFGACFSAPAQNPKAKYIGYVFPEAKLKNGIWYNDKYKMRYFKNKYIENNLKNIFNNSKDLYFIYTEPGLGYKHKDINLIKNSIRYYSEDKITKLNNCEEITYYIFGYINTNQKHIICKLK